MSAKDLLNLFDDIANCGTAIELLPIAREIRERNDLSQQDREQLQAKINDQLKRISK